jgi:16S rRNA C967 or C1407 C5-methylase (RsmB/RsmF family)
VGHGSWTIFGMDPHGKAAVDNKPDRLRVLPANLSKVGAETSSLHTKQSFKAQSGAGPLLGT